MGTDATKPITLESIIEHTLRGELTKELAQHAVAMGTEAMIAVALAASARIAEQDARLLAQDARLAELSAAGGQSIAASLASSAHTPSGAIPPYAKPSTSKRRRGKPGARNGHKGSRRAAPAAEREIRPAVILRKNSQCNRSERGAATQAVLMSIYRTLKLRGHDPRQSIVNALTAYAATAQLPPLLSPPTANG